MQAEATHLARLLRDTAATAILPHWQGVTARHKPNGSFVTESDLAAQCYLAEALARDFPGIPLLGEEMTRTEQEQMLQHADGALWVVDPLDGTSNYTAGFPAFAISLALIEGGRAVLGAILDPVRDECFVAVRGQGAFMDGRPIRPFAPSRLLKECLAVVDLKRLPPEWLPPVTGHACFGSQRNLGSVALEWCWLASGRFQLYLHGGQKLWDHAAGRLIADEAGVASWQLIPGSLNSSPTLTLEPQLAIAAANAELLRAWSDCLGLAVDSDG
ncbi:MAG: inositol monophosphatase family protein [Thermochromatium sp.]